MKNTVFHLSTCSTCKRILSEVNLDSFEVVDIKKNPINEEQLAFLFSKTTSYEALFSRKAQLYKAYDLKNKTLTETDYKNYLLEHYTFLNRPVFVVNKQVFVGSKKENIKKIISFL